MIDSDHFGTSINTAALGRFLRNAQRQVGLAGEVNVLITSDEEMRRLNREFRRKNKPTDVLSFRSSLNGKSGIAGDIAISAQIARANAEVLGHPLESEIKVLLLHGLLHLAGYDHESDAGKMARLEQRLRAKLKLPMSLTERTRTAGSKCNLVVPAAPGRAFGMGRANGRAKKTIEGGRNHANHGRNRRSALRAKEKFVINRNGTAEAVPFPKASSSVISVPSVVNQPTQSKTRLARRTP